MPWSWRVAVRVVGRQGERETRGMQEEAWRGKESYTEGQESIKRGQ